MAPEREEGGIGTMAPEREEGVLNHLFLVGNEVQRLRQEVRKLYLSYTSHYSPGFTGLQVLILVCIYFTLFIRFHRFTGLNISVHILHIIHQVSQVYRS